MSCCESFAAIVKWVERCRKEGHTVKGWSETIVIDPPSSHVSSSQTQPLKILKKTQKSLPQPKKMLRKKKNYLSLKKFKIIPNSSSSEKTQIHWEMHGSLIYIYI